MEYNLFLPIHIYTHTIIKIVVIFLFNINIPRA